MHPENNIYIIVYNRVQLTAGKHSHMQAERQTQKDVYGHERSSVTSDLVQE